MLVENTHVYGYSEIQFIQERQDSFPYTPILVFITWQRSCKTNLMLTHWDLWRLSRNVKKSQGFYILNQWENNNLPNYEWLPPFLKAWLLICVYQEYAGM